MSLLAITFAFGLASLGTAVAVSVRTYLSAAVRQEHDILDRIALESATAQTLGEITATGRLPAGYPGPVTVGRVTLEWSLPSEKFDPAADSKPDISAEITASGVNSPAALLTDALAAGTLAEASALLKLSARQEDALRRRLTFGRAPAPRLSDVPQVNQVLSPGEQVDVRAAVMNDGRQRILWTRARLSSAGGQIWQVHDYRLIASLGGR